MSVFDQDLVWQHRETPCLSDPHSSRFTGKISAAWSIGQNPNGGYLLAKAAHALTKVVPNHPHPLSITAHYQRPGLGDQDCDIHVQLLRSGQSISTLSASLKQEGKSRLELIASFGDLARAPKNMESPEFQIAAPSILAPDACPQRTGHAQGVDLPILQRLDVRLAPASLHQAEVNGWVRFTDGRPPDVLACLLFADAFPPAVFGKLGMVGWVPTIELTLHIRRIPCAGWVQGRFVCDDLSDGRMIEHGWLWDQQGQLIAQSRQLAMLLPKS
jgi:acyl-CoA thioesterase